MTSPDPSPRWSPITSRRWYFAFIYVLANVGAAICFVPLIGLLLPQRTTLLDGDAGAQLLGWTLLSGAIVASGSNIVAGWLSDRAMVRHQSRMPLVTLGFAATLCSFGAIAAAESPAGLMAAFLLFQLCFNLFFAPFNALAADHVDDAIKGRVFGLMGLAVPVAQSATVAIVAMGIDGLAMRLGFVALLASLALMPLLLIGQRLAGPPIASRIITSEETAALTEPDIRRDFVLAWLGRLLVQYAAIAVGSYLFLHLTTVVLQAGLAGKEEGWFAALSMIMLVAGLSVGVVIGQWSDRAARRLPFLCIGALLVGLGCAILAMGESWFAIMLGYALFAVGIAGFQAIDGAVIAQLIGSGDRRASRLGLINLTNTLPSMMVPGLALSIGQGVQSATMWLFATAAGGAMVAALLATRIRTIA